MARVVVDPGVLVSALIAPKGTPAQLVDQLLEQRFELVASPRLLAELIADLASVAIMFADPLDPPAVSRDRNDDYLLALAVVAGADALVSGDRDLTDLASPPVPVLTPRAFLDRLDEAGRG